jgi:quercetin dioxygenase-like cupin family protein
MNYSLKKNDYQFVEKPWGYEKIIVHNEKYALKEIFMNAGVRSSLQSHNYKLETIYVLKGEIELEVRVNDETIKEIYISGESYTIVPNQIHRVKVIKDALLHEVSTPEIDDVIRHSDDFNR